MAFNLPQDFNINLPELQELASNAVGFEPNQSLPRVTDVQRERDAIAYHEQNNAALNLKDSLGVASTYLTAAIAATKIGKSLVSYQIGLQDIRTEKVNYQKAGVRTAIASTELQELNLKLEFQNGLLPELERGYQGALKDARVKAETAHRSAEKARFILDTKYPVIDVQAMLVA
jgi:hypothetical protein